MKSWRVPMSCSRNQPAFIWTSLHIDQRNQGLLLNLCVRCTNHRRRFDHHERRQAMELVLVIVGLSHLALEP